MCVTLWTVCRPGPRRCGSRPTRWRGRRAALPTRLAWLSTRRANHREVDRSLQGTWLLVADDVRWTVSVDGDGVHSAPAGPGAVMARAAISGTRRDLLALLLGRPPLHALTIDGDLAFGAAFERAFPGP